MITQKPISLKIDFDTLQDLDALVKDGVGRNRNQLINRAIRTYIRLYVANRKSRFDGTAKQYDSSIINSFWHQEFGYKFDLK